ncbi:ribonuclease 2B [Mus pahari]|uniref:ribonuclease 2B n=1 Tax=Mus pahari TaxID=10093 RepID=UPI000A3112E6|nr:ribonuclease 2B [Mus pahari]
MGPKLLESRLCFLLLLGLVLTLVSCQRPTPSQKFDIQHIYKNAYPKCDDAMRVVNKYTGKCKDLNTFLHTTFADVVRVCRNQPKTCKDGTSKNCHDSSSQVSVTICKLTRRARSYTQCRYKTTGAKKSYTVACNPRTPQDSPTYPVVPVHLDRIF